MTRWLPRTSSANSPRTKPEGGGRGGDDVRPVEPRRDRRGDRGLPERVRADDIDRASDLGVVDEPRQGPDLVVQRDPGPVLLPLTRSARPAELCQQDEAGRRAPVASMTRPVRARATGALEAAAWSGRCFPVPDQPGRKP